MSDKLTAWEQYKKNLGDSRPWDIINPNTVWVEESLAKERYSICQSCPELIKLTKTCKRCGCFMTAKTKLEKATCPLGKW